VIVVSYPKSGRTWLIHMLADYYGYCLPHRIFNERGKQWLTECRLSCRNWVYGYHRIDAGSLARIRDTYGKRVVYMIRDPRDCMVSLYFYRRYIQEPWNMRLRFRLKTLLSQVGFLRTCLNEWKQHVAAYRPLCDECVSYEALVADPVGTLARLVGADPADMERVRRAVTCNTFEAHSGRRPGQENPRRFARKGIVGDWKNHYDSPRFKALFKRIVGDDLIQWGYEKDMNW